MKLLKKSLCLFLIMMFIFFNISTFTFVSSASTSKKTYYYMTADAEPRFSVNAKNKDYYSITLNDDQGISSFNLKAYNETTKKYDVDLIPDNMNSNTLSKRNENSNFTYIEKTKTIKINKEYFTTVGKYMNFRLQVTDASTKTKSKKNTLTAYFQVKKLAKKASDGNYFYLNNSPRITTNNLGSSTNTTATTNFDTKAKALTGLSIKVVDNTGISNLKLEDMNNTNKAAESENYSTGSEKQTNITYKLDLSKYTEKDGWYRIKITVTDKSGMKRVCQRFYKVCSHSIELQKTSSKQTYYYMAADAEPRFSVSATNKNYFYITLRDSQGISSFSLKAYNEKTQKYDVDLILGGDTDSNTSGVINKNFKYTEKTKTIRISKEYFDTVDKYMNFELKVTDGISNKSQKNTLTTYFQVKRLADKNSSGNYFYLNNSPRVVTNNLGSKTNTTSTANFVSKDKALTGLSINVVDYTGISNLTLEDMNNTNKAPESENYSTGTEKQTNITYKLDLSKYTEKDGWYRIKITVTDKSGMERICQRFYKVCSHSIELTETNTKKETDEEDNVDAVNKETEEATKKEAEEQEAKQAAEEAAKKAAEEAEKKQASTTTTQTKTKTQSLPTSKDIEKFDMQTNYPKVAFNAISTSGKTLTSGKTIKSSGCAPTSLGNVMRTYLGIPSVSTKSLCTWCRTASYRNSKGEKQMVRTPNGVKTTAMVRLASKKWNFNYSVYDTRATGKSYSTGFDKALAHVKAGKMGLITLNGYPFSSGGHAVALVGYKGNKIAIWDSYFSAHKSNYAKDGIEMSKNVDGLIYVSKSQTKRFKEYIFISKK